MPPRKHVQTDPAQLVMLLDGIDLNARLGRKTKKPAWTLLSKQAFSGSCAGAQLHVDNWVCGPN
jgi:hypothetical protein